MAYKNKSKSRTLTLGERKTMRQNRKESKSIPKAAARAKPHGEEKKKKPKAGTERRNKSCGRKKEKKKKKEKKGILTLTSVTCVLKLELSHLMRETICPSFIGGA